MNAAGNIPCASALGACELCGLVRPGCVCTVPKTAIERRVDALLREPGLGIPELEEALRLLTEEAPRG